MNWLTDVEPAPKILVRPGAAASLDEAHSAIELWEHYSRKRLDPAQVQAVEVMMATAPGGKWAASTTGRCMSRQQGKGDEIEVPELHGLVQRAEAILHTVHDAVLLASQAQQRMLSVLEAHADLRRLIKRKWLGTGQQMIELRNGGVIWYRTRTGGGGRGVDDIDRLVVDEAQHATEEHLAALSPTMLANDNAQLNALGSAGIEGRSTWWWQMRIRALGADPGAFGYIEHTAETVYLDEGGYPVQEPVDHADRSLWLGANPAMHAGRGQGMEFLEEQYRRLDVRSFCREHLGVWDPPPLAGVVSIVSAGDWGSCLDLLSQPGPKVAYALDVAPEGRSASIAASDGTHLEIVANSDGTSWVVPLCVARRDRFSEIVLDPAGPAGAMARALEAEGLTVREVNTREAVAACGQFLTAVTDRTVRHLDQPELNRAVANADRRIVGDGGWLWSRKRSSVDISPLVAVTLARWAALSAPSKPVFAH